MIKVWKNNGSRTGQGEEFELFEKHTIILCQLKNSVPDQRANINVNEENEEE